VSKEELIKKYAMRRGAQKKRIELYAIEVETRTDAEGKIQVITRREDISLDGRFYVVFKDATASERRALEAAAGRKRWVREGDRDIIEFHAWDLIEAALAQQLIVEMKLPQLDEEGNLTEYHLPEGYSPTRAINEVNNRLTGALEDVLARMIQDYYFGEEEEEIVEEAKNS